MNIRLGRMPWAIGWLFCGSLVAANPPSSDEIARLVQQLGASDFGSRETATVLLTSAGEAAVGPLIDSISNDKSEVQWRAVAALQKIAIAVDAATYTRIVAAVRQASEQRGGNLTMLLRDLSVQRAAHRRSVAHEKIRLFGGRFGDDEAEITIATVRQTDVPLPAPPPDLPPDGKKPATAVEQATVLIADAYVSPLLSKDIVSTPARESLIIDQNWRGGDEGLAPLCDIPELSSLNLNRAPLTDAALETIAQMPAIQSLEIEDTPFSAPALAKFRTRQPRARVVARGAKLLEVSAER